MEPKKRVSSNSAKQAKKEQLESLLYAGSVRLG